MNYLHLHEFKEVKHIARETLVKTLVKTKVWSVMCEMSSTDNSAIVQSTTERPL